jgi:hypothetical protein
VIRDVGRIPVQVRDQETRIGRSESLEYADANVMGEFGNAMELYCA